MQPVTTKSDYSVHTTTDNFDRFLATQNSRLRPLGSDAQAGLVSNRETAQRHIQSAEHNVRNAHLLANLGSPQYQERAITAFAAAEEKYNQAAQFSKNAYIVSGATDELQNTTQTIAKAGVLQAQKNTARLNLYTLESAHNNVVGNPVPPPVRQETLQIKNEATVAAALANRSKPHPAADGPAVQNYIALLKQAVEKYEQAGQAFGELYALYGHAIDKVYSRTMFETATLYSNEIQSNYGILAELQRQKPMG